MLMTMAWKYLFLWICLLHNVNCQGYSLVMTGSPKRPSFTLTCTVNNSAGLDDVVWFNRNTSEGAIVTIRQFTGHCYLFTSSSSRYDGSCGSGTDSTASQTKNYTLNITEVKSEDISVWWCSLQAGGKQSNTFTVTFDRYSLVMTGSPKRPSLTLTCTVNNSAGLDDVVLFNRKTSVGAIVTIRQSSGHCSFFTSSSSRYVGSCGSGTENTGAQTKTYTLNITEVKNEDITVWWCSLEADGTQSNTFAVTFNDYSLVMRGSPKHPSFTLTCTVNNATGLGDVVLFNRNTSEGAIVTIRQSSWHCYVFTSLSSRYVASCGYGTENTATKTKTYTLKITAVKNEDLAVWWCSLEADGTQSNKFTVTFESYSLVMTGFRKRPSFTLTCTVNNSAGLDDDVLFNRDTSGGAIVTIRQTTGHCYFFTSLSSRYVASCGSGTENRTTKTKTYTVKITEVKNEDITVWWCSLEADGTQSNKFKLKFYSYSLVMTGSPKRPSFTLTCTVNNATGLGDIVLFNRKTGVGAIVTIRQSSGYCYVFTLSPSGYVGSCGNGTENTGAQTKTYTLKITAVKNEDLTVWWCSLEADGTQSNKFTVTFERYSMVMTGSPKRPSFTLTCTINNAAGLGDIVLFNRNTSVGAIVTIRQSTAHCYLFTSSPSGYVGSCGSGTENRATWTKTYTLEITEVKNKDLTSWWCSLQANGKQSNNFTVEFDSYSLVMTGSPKRPSFTLTCTVNNAVGLADIVLFNRNISEGAIVTIRQTTGHCYLFTLSACGYVGSCGNGTENTATQTKTYTLNITEVKSEDLTVWFCSLLDDGTQSNKFTVTSDTVSAAENVAAVSPVDNAAGGYLLAITGSANRRSFTLTCTVGNAAGLHDLVLFKRSTTAGTITSMLQSNANCSLFNLPPTGYIAACGSGTDNTASKTKTYTLKMTEVKSKDLTVWWCAVLKDQTESNKIKVAFDIYSSSEISDDSDTHGYSLVMTGLRNGRSFTLTCTVTEAAGLDDLISFNKETTQVSLAILSQSLWTGCSVFHVPPSGYIVTCEQGTEEISTRTKTYSLKINEVSDEDATDWWCALLEDGTVSNSYTLDLRG